MVEGEPSNESKIGEAPRRGRGMYRGRGARGGVGRNLGGMGRRRKASSDGDGQMEMPVIIDSSEGEGGLRNVVRGSRRGRGGFVRGRRGRGRAGSDGDGQLEIPVRSESSEGEEGSRRSARGMRRGRGGLRRRGRVGFRRSGRGRSQGVDVNGHESDNLAIKTLEIEMQKYDFEMKQNEKWGKFIKVSEICLDGRSSQIFFALSIAAELIEKLYSFSECCSNLRPHSPKDLVQDGKLMSEVMIKNNRRYYVDLEENKCGRFLRISQTANVRGQWARRSQIAFPAQGLDEFRDIVSDLVKEFGTDDGNCQDELPEGSHCRIENRSYYFDFGKNTRGTYMKISEVSSNYRTSITVPEKFWSRFRDIFENYLGGDKEVKDDCTQQKQVQNKDKKNKEVEGAESLQTKFLRMELHEDLESVKQTELCDIGTTDMSKKPKVELEKSKSLGEVVTEVEPKKKQQESEKYKKMD